MKCAAILAIGAVSAQEICRNGEAASDMIKRGKAAQWAARSERLSAALRENLKRRKAQARGRSAGAAGGGLPEPDPGMAAAPDFRRNPGPKSDAQSGGPATGRRGS
jgi:hypothetical protein